MPTVEDAVWAAIDEQTAGVPLPAVPHDAGAAGRERPARGRRRHALQRVECAQAGTTQQPDRLFRRLFGHVAIVRSFEEDGTRGQGRAKIIGSTLVQEYQAPAIIIA